MAKRALRQKLDKLLARAGEEKDKTLYWRALAALGWEGSKEPTAKELEALFQGVPNERAEKVLQILSCHKGAATTVPKRIQELTHFWEAQLQSIEDLADPELLAEARSLTSADNVCRLDRGGPVEETRFTLYMTLTKFTDKYNPKAGLICGVGKVDFERVIVASLLMGRRLTVIKMFAERCDDFGARQIRKQIARFFEHASSFAEGLVELENHMKAQQPLIELLYREELAKLVKLILIADAGHSLLKKV